MPGRNVPCPRTIYSLMPPRNYDSNAGVAKSGFFYGWVIVAASATLLAMQAGTMYSFSVFFKPLAADFGWTRGATAGVYSAYMICHGISAIPVGWLADRFGPAKVMASCGFMVGLGLVLTSQVNALWQIYLTYGLIVGSASSATFAIGMSTTARWFALRRGLALGIVSAGIGLGTLLMLPIAERLIAAFGWSGAYLLLGIASWVVLMTAAPLLRRDPGAMGQRPYGLKEPMLRGDADRNRATAHAAMESGSTLRTAARSRALWLLIWLYFLFNFSVQVIMVHLVNYVTDLGILALVAATLVSVVGVGSTTGRLVMGTASDRIGSGNALVICCTALMITLLWLIFARHLWMFYLFAITFGFAYGGGVPQMTALVGEFFGLRAATALVASVVLGATAGGALASWMAGQIFDATHSYEAALAIAATASFLSLLATLILKRQHTLVV